MNTIEIIIKISRPKHRQWMRSIGMTDRKFMRSLNTYTIKVIN